MGTLVEKVEIKIDGNPYEAYNFYNFRLSQNLLIPNELSFTMQKKAFEGSTIADSRFDIPKKLMGAKVEFAIIAMRHDTEEKKILKFEGVIVDVNISHRSNMHAEQLIDVQAASRDYLLIDHPHCFSYENMSLKDVVAATLKPYDIRNKINPRTTGAIPYTVQYNESNYQFLKRLANRYGEWMYHDGEQWIFGEMIEKGPVVLNPHNDIREYYFHASLVHHKLKHAHHDYLKYENPDQSDSDYGISDPGFHVLTDEATKKSASLFTKNTFQHLQCSNPEVNGIDELEVSTKAQLFGEKTGMVVCSGSTVRADLTIGSKIKIIDHLYNTEKDRSDIEHDILIITDITHTTEIDGHYSNTFTAYPYSQYPPYKQSDRFPVSAAQRAKVMDNVDPEKLGRIRVQFLWQEKQDPNLMTPWIRIAQPYGGHEKGFYFIPEIGEEVMIDFENGNAEKPYVAGTLYHGTQRPRDNWTNDVATNDIKGIRSRNGHGIVYQDNHESGKGFIMMYDAIHNTIAIDADLNRIYLHSYGDIEMHADKDIIMTAGGNRLSTIAGLDDVKAESHNYKAKEAIHIEGKTLFAQGKDKATIDSGSLVQIQSNSTTNVLGNGSVFVGSGGNLDVSADASMKINASATMDIKAGAPMTVKGAVVKIN